MPFFAKKNMFHILYDNNLLAQPFAMLLTENCELNIVVARESLLLLIFVKLSF